MRFLKKRQAVKLDKMSSKHSQPDRRSTATREDPPRSVKPTDHLDLSQAVPELAVVATEHPDHVIGLVSEIGRDIWFGDKYLECVLAELLLQNSSKVEQRTVLDVSHPNTGLELGTVNISQ